jgi:predicted NAD/FAD-dependent oxidoreductase
MAKQKERAGAIVVGGGIAGLAAARTLGAAGVPVTVLEAEEAVGGRMTTRTFSGGVFDVGAQFFTVKDERFAAFVNDWVRRGVVRDWFHSHLIQGGEATPDGHPRYMGAAGMRTLAEDLAEEAEVAVRTGSRVMAADRTKGGYRVTLESGEELEGEALVIALPAPQALALLEAGPMDVPEVFEEEIGCVEYSPCITVLATLEGPSGLTEWGGLRIEGEYIDWIADNQRKGISPDAVAITIQAMPGFSRERWQWEDERLAEVLLDNARRLLVADPASWLVHRWELGKPRSVASREFIPCREDPRCVLAGDSYKGYRVEGAVISGYEAARHLLDELKGPPA